MQGNTSPVSGRSDGFVPRKRQSKHAGTARNMTSRGISNSFRGSDRQRHGEPVHYVGAHTKSYPWVRRAKNRLANKAARRSRKINRP